MTQPGNAGPPFDAFSRFWTEMLSQSGAPGAGFTPSPETIKQMRAGFFEAWAKHCDEFLRSEQFLEMLKQSMDASMLFRQQINQFLTRCLEDAQVPSRTDSDSLMRVMRSVEERVLDRLDSLEQRLEQFEKTAASNGREAAGSAGTRKPTRKA